MNCKGSPVGRWHVIGVSYPLFFCRCGAWFAVGLSWDYLLVAVSFAGMTYSAVIGTVPLNYLEMAMVYLVQPLFIFARYGALLQMVTGTGGVRGPDRSWYV